MQYDKNLLDHQRQLSQCRRCPAVIAPPVFGLPVRSRVMMIGQAPGIHEQEQLRPFSWTAGKRLFQWFETAGLAERAFRRSVYMTAVARCFPGRNKKGGDRVPSRLEIANCRSWLDNEFDELQPKLIIPVGKLAISRLLKPAPLADTVGQMFTISVRGCRCDAIPLPHPSGASSWIHTTPGKDLLPAALDLLASHPEWLRLVADYNGE